MSEREITMLPLSEVVKVVRGCDITFAPNRSGRLQSQVDNARANIERALVELAKRQEAASPLPSGGVEEKIEPIVSDVFAGRLTTKQGTRALLSALPVTGGGWQPIETAPKDKSMLALLYVNGQHTRYGVGWYMPMDGWRGWYDQTFHREPTHWSPLPAPPTPVPVIPENEGEGQAK